MFPLPGIVAPGTAASGQSVVEGLGAYAAPAMGFKPGRYYNLTASKASPTFSAVNLNANFITFTPIYVFKDVNIASVVVENTSSANSGNKIRVGLYANDGGQPSTLIYAAPEITLDNTAAAREFSAGISLSKGWYWGAFTTDKTPSMQSCATNNLIDSTWGRMGGPNFVSVNTGTITNAVAATYADLPATAPATSTNAVAAPIFGIKVA